MYQLVERLTLQNSCIVHTSPTVGTGRFTGSLCFLGCNNERGTFSQPRSIKKLCLVSMRQSVLSFTFYFFFVLLQDLTIVV